MLHAVNMLKFNMAAKMAAIAFPMPFLMNIYFTIYTLTTEGASPRHTIPLHFLLPCGLSIRNKFGEHLEEINIRENPRWPTRSLSKTISVHKFLF